MNRSDVSLLVLRAGWAIGMGLATPSVADATASPPRTMADVIAASTPADWRPLDPENTLYLQLAQGRVVIELAPSFAPQHAANIRTLARGKYFDDLAIVRAQDNFVVQWGDTVLPGQRCHPNSRSS
jgi:peptidylprolyl isomerase